MGEIAEALKRQREERESTKESAAPPSTGSTPSAQPGRSELLEALKEAPPARLPASEPQGLGTTTASALAAAAAEASRRDESTMDAAEIDAIELDEDALSAVGKTDIHRQLALQVAAQLEQRSARTLAVMSALRDEGKTTVATTLAMALASVRSHRSVALVDLDMRNPSVARRLGLATSAGVEHFLLGHASLEDIRISIASPQLDVYPSVEHQPSAHELLARPQLASLIATLEQRYETVIIDTPPTLIVPDASLLLKRVRFCVAVARAGITRARRFEEMLDILPPEAVMGKVLNSANMPSREKDYYTYGYEPEEQAETAPEPEAQPSA